MSRSDGLRVHRAFLTHVASTSRTWLALTPSQPAGLVVVCAPDAFVDDWSESPFVLLVAAPSLFVAAENVRELLAAESPPGYAPEWWATLEWAGFKSRRFVSWWPRIGTAAYGSLTSLGHPEVPPLIDVLAYPSKPSQVDTRPFSLALLQDITELRRVDDADGDVGLPDDGLLS